MPRTSTSRSDFLAGAASLFRRRGYNGTGLKEITSESGAPWGSLYHHFPGGKTQLGVEAIRHSGAGYQRLIAKTLGEADDPVEGLFRFFTYAANALEASNFEDGCPIATTALDTAATNPEVRDACAAVFTSWLDDLNALLEPTFGAEKARQVGMLALCALEGGFILSRTLCSTQPLNDTADTLRTLLQRDDAASH